MMQHSELDRLLWVRTHLKSYSVHTNIMSFN